MMSCLVIPAIVDCGDPPAISNGGRNWTTGSPAPIGTTVTYTCDSNYTTDGADMVVCKGDGSWTAPPSCDGTCSHLFRYYVVNKMSHLRYCFIVEMMSRLVIFQLLLIVGIPLQLAMVDAIGRQIAPPLLVPQ